MAKQRTRIQNVSTIQTVKATPGVIHSILLSNGGGAAYTLTLTDGSTVLNVINLPASATLPIVMDLPFNTSVKVTPNNAAVDALIVWS